MTPVTRTPDGRFEVTLGDILYRWRMRAGVIADPVWVGTQGIERPLKVQGLYAALEDLARAADPQPAEVTPRPAVAKQGLLFGGEGLG